MTIEKLVVDPRYLRLTVQQRVFVKTLCENGGDKRAAAYAAWTCSNDNSATTMANRALRKSEIFKLQNEYFGKDVTDEKFTREEFLATAARRARLSDEDGDAYKFMTLIAGIEGWLKRPAEALPESPGDKEASVAELIRTLEG